MAGKRMFTMQIMDSDAFLDMPSSTQALYVHLNMRADDDGFVGNPKTITRMVGAAEDDLKLLIAKGFLLAFDTGVIVVKHWRMHNTLSSKTYHETQYIEEKATLLLKENGAYSFTDGMPIDDGKVKALQERRRISDKQRKIDKRRTDDERTTNRHDDADEETTRADKIRLDKNRLDKNRLEEVSILTVSNDTVCRTDVQRIVDEWNSLGVYGIKGIQKLTPNTKRYDSLIARLKQYTVEDVLTAIDNIRHSDFLQGKNKTGWMIVFDWFVLPNNFVKVLEGNYDNRPETMTAKTGSVYDKMQDWLQGGNYT